MNRVRRLALSRNRAAARARRQYLPLRAPVRHGAGARQPILDVLLDLINSQITYRSRYLVGVAPYPVRDMAAARSL